MNKKGFSLVELSISLVLISIILFSMMNLLVSVRDFETVSNEWNSNTISQDIIVKGINYDIIKNNLQSINCSGMSCNLNFPGKNMTLKIQDNKTVLYYENGNPNNPIVSETICSVCGKYSKIELSYIESATGLIKSTNDFDIESGDILKILIKHSNPEYNCEITYYKAS